MALGNICFCIHFLRVKTNRNIHLAVCGFPTFRYLTGWGWWEWWDVRINSSSFSLPFPQIIRIHRSQERPSGRKLRCTGGTVQWQTPAYMVGRGGISDGPAFHKDGLRQWVQGKARVLSRYPFRTPMHKHWYISSLPCTRKTCHFVDCFGSEECFGNGIADAFCKLNNLIWIIIITASNFWDKTKVLSEGEQGGGTAEVFRASQICCLHTLHLSDMTRRETGTIKTCMGSTGFCDILSGNEDWQSHSQVCCFQSCTLNKTEETTEN